MNTSITDKLPIDALGDTIVGTIQGPVADSVHRVGELVPDQVPDLVADGVVRGRRFGRRLVGRSDSSNTTRWLIVATTATLAGALVFWWSRRSRREADPRDNWSTIGTSPAADRVA